MMLLSAVTLSLHDSCAVWLYVTIPDDSIRYIVQDQGIASISTRRCKGITVFELLCIENKLIDNKHVA